MLSKFHETNRETDNAFMNEECFNNGYLEAAE